MLRCICGILPFYFRREIGVGFVNRFKCLFVRLMTLVIALGLLAGGVGALAEAPNPGLDVVIVIDFTFSTFPGVDSPRGVDQQLMCLDAAAMLINMCDANYSKAAIVPFTDGNDAIESYNRANGNMWGRWIDVSDPASIKLSYQDRIEVQLGDGTDLQYRIQYMIGALEKLSGNAKGVLDLTFALGEQAVFHPLA